MTGKQLAVYETMKSFISIKYYTTEDVAVEILKAFQVTEDLTPTQYTELSLLARNIYNPPVVEEIPTEPLQ